MSAVPWKRKLRASIFSFLSVLLVRVCRRFTTPIVAKELVSALLGENAQARVAGALCVFGHGQQAMDEVLQRGYDWQQFLTPIDRGERVLLVGQDRGSALIAQLLHERGCLLTRAEVHHLPVGLSEDEHAQLFTAGVDWQQERFPDPQNFDWAVVGPEIAVLYHRAALLEWLHRRYQLQRFLLRLPLLPPVDQTAAALAVGAPLSQRYRVLYDEASVRLEWSGDYRMQGTRRADPLPELHLQLERQPVILETADRPLVSVIIPVYNVEPYLRRCLDSVIQQSLSQIEIIVVNDASPDGCGAIISAYQQREPRLSVLSNPSNVGLGLTRNRGLEKAQGEYVFFLDSDDYLHPDCLRTLYLLALRSGSTAVIQVNARYPVPTAELTCYLRHQGQGKLVLPFETPYFTSSVFNLYQRQMLHDHQLRFLPGYYEDQLFSLALTNLDEPLLLAPVSLLFYYQRPSSITNKAIDERKIKDYAQVMRDLREKLQQWRWFEQQAHGHRYLQMLTRYWQVWLSPPMLARILTAKKFALLELFWQENQSLFDVPGDGIFRLLRQQGWQPPTRGRKWWPFLLEVARWLNNLSTQEDGEVTLAARQHWQQKFCCRQIYASAIKGQSRD